MCAYFTDYSFSLLLLSPNDLRHDLRTSFFLRNQESLEFPLLPFQTRVGATGRTRTGLNTRQYQVKDNRRIQVLLEPMLAPQPQIFRWCAFLVSRIHQPQLAMSTKYTIKTNLVRQHLLIPTDFLSDRRQDERPELGMMRQ
jgi:hypothetical protein